jgi:hypothetical protein
MQSYEHSHHSTSEKYTFLGDKFLLFLIRSRAKFKWLPYVPFWGR